MAQAGIVQAISGAVTAQNTDGQTRELHVGDIVYANEIVNTGVGATISIAQEDGNLIELTENNQLMLDESVLGNVASTDAAITNGEELTDLQEELLAALEEDGDIDAILEETAAGDEATAGIDGAYDFSTGYYAGDAKAGDVGSYLLGTVNAKFSEDFDQQPNDSDDAILTPVPSVTVPSVTVTGGDVSEGDIATFEVELDSAYDSPATINLSLGTLGDIAKTTDYDTSLTSMTVKYVDDSGVTQTLAVTANGDVIIPSGVTRLIVGVQTTDDNVYEGPETFTLAATTATSSDEDVARILDDGTGPGPEPDNDSPDVTVGDVVVNEGSTANFDVTLSNAAATEQTLTLSLTNDTADGNDYNINPENITVQYIDNAGDPQTIATGVDASGNVIVPAGATELIVSVNTTLDNTFEGPETFTLTAALDAGTIHERSDDGQASIRDDGTGPDPDGPSTPDDDTPTVAIAVNPASVDEDGDQVLTYTITLSNPSDEATTVTYDLTGSAEAGDYTTTGTGTVTIPAGQTTATFTVDPTADYIVEADETVIATITGAHTNGVDLNAIPGQEAATGTIVNDDTIPVVENVQNAVISEEGLTDGIEDTSGNPTDTTNFNTFNGTFEATDADGNSLTATISADTVSSLNTDSITSGQQEVHFDLSSNAQILTGYTGFGTATQEAVITLTLHTIDNQTGQGTYDVTLHKPLDHATAQGENLLNFDVGIQVSDGHNPAVTSTINVTVEDDSPMNGDITQSLNISQQDTNLMFIIDTSSSMDTEVTHPTTGLLVERMDIFLEAVEDVINEYQGIGEVKIQFATFSDRSETYYQEQDWMTATEALEYIGANGGTRNASLTIEGWTDYSLGVERAESAYGRDGKLDTGNNVSYFLSDGAPVSGYDPNWNFIVTEMTEEEVEGWTTFLTDEHIDSYAVGFGAVSPDDGSNITPAYLHPLAYDGTTGEDRDGEVAPDAQSLNDNLLATIQEPVMGNIFDQIEGGGFGADGGSFLSITHNDVTYSWDGTQITPSDGSDVTQGNRLTIDPTAEGAELIIDFADGHYEYKPGANLSLGDHYTETFNYTISDNDGDQSTGNINLDVSRGDFITANADSYPDGGIMQAGLIGEYYGIDVDNYDTVPEYEADKSDGAYSYLIDNVADFRDLIDGETPDATFTAESIFYSQFGDTLSVDKHLQKFLGQDTNGDDVLINWNDENNHEEGGLQLTGHIYLTAGKYIMSARADDGFQILLDGRSVVEADGNHPPRDFKGEIFTIDSAGYYPLDIIYWDQGKDYVFEPQLATVDEDGNIGAYQALTTDNFTLTHGAFDEHPLIGKEGEALTIDADYLLANDIDSEGDVIHIADVHGASDGSVSIDANGDIVFTPPSDFTGEASFTYTVTDETDTSAPATVKVYIAPQNAVFNEEIALDTSAPVDIDGALGFDTLLVEDTALDFSSIASGAIQNMEKIELNSQEAQQIELRLEDVLTMTDGENTLQIEGGVNDEVRITDLTSGNWTQDQGNPGLFTRDIPTGTQSIEIDCSDDSDGSFKVIIDDGTAIG